MKPKIRTPYFEIGTKNYIYGDTVSSSAQNPMCCRSAGSPRIPNI